MKTLNDFLTELKIREAEINKAKKIAKLFKIQKTNGDIVRGDEALVDGQLEIFYAIIFRPSNRININCCTQYGKSLTVALACVYLTCVLGKKVSIVAPSKEKTKIIMRYYIEHIGDSLLFSTQLEANTKLERLKQEGSKERIILRNGGGIYGISADAKNSNRSMESAMGEGADIVIVDEACLIPDTTEATLFRMIAGRGENGFYIKIGNPFYIDPPYEHFYLSSNSDRYLQIFIDYKQALREGRYSQDVIDEARKKPAFRVLFESLFPERDEIDDKGYRRLLTIEEIRSFMTEKIPPEKGKFRLGADIGRGGNYNYYVGRDDNFAWTYGKNKSNDTMTNVTEVTNAKPDIAMIDDVGVGGGVTDRLSEVGEVSIIRVVSGGKSSETEVYANNRAEAFWKLREWLLGGGRLEKDDCWLVLYQIKYKWNSAGKMMLESKDEMRKRCKEQLVAFGDSDSPDAIDALSFTFLEDKIPTIEIIE